MYGKSSPIFFPFLFFLLLFTITYYKYHLIFLCRNKFVVFGQNNKEHRESDGDTVSEQEEDNSPLR